MFRNLGKGEFDKVSESLGPDFIRPIVGRGLQLRILITMATLTS